MRTYCSLLVGVVVGWAASGVDWTRDAIGQDRPSLRRDLPGAPALDSKEFEDSSIEELFPKEATATTTVTEGVIPAPPQKGLADWLGEAQKSAGIGRYLLKVQGSNGYFIIDSLTGRIWYGPAGGTPRLIVSELPQK